jgi:hypothetical protein
VPARAKISPFSEEAYRDPPRDNLPLTEQFFAHDPQ